MDWTSVKIKGWSIYVDLGKLEEDNWRPRLNVVEKILLALKPRRSLSYGVGLLSGSYKGPYDTTTANLCDGRGNMGRSCRFGAKFGLLRGTTATSKHIKHKHSP